MVNVLRGAGILFAGGANFALHEEHQALSWVLLGACILGLLLMLALGKRSN